MTEQSQGTEPLYASVDGMATPLSENECIFLSRQDDQAHVMTLDVLRAMEICRPFRTIEQHARRIQEGIESLSGQGTAVRTVLQHLVDRGLIRTTEQLPRPEPSDSGGDEAPVGLILGRNAALLGPAMAAAAGLENPPERWHVLDGSPDSAVDQVRSQVAELAGSGVQVVHADREYRRRLVDHLAATLGLDAEALAGGLDSSPSGLWNTGLLLSAGRPAAVQDEAERHAPRQRAEASEDWSLASVSQAPITLVRDDAVFDQALTPLEQDPLAQQARICGRSLATLMGDGLAASLAGLSWRDAAEFSRARVLMCRSGTWGDVPESTNAWVYQTPPLALPHVAPDREQYYRWLRRPLGARGFDLYQVARAASRFPGFLDASGLLPPAPVQVAECDFGFGAWSRFLHPDGVVAHLPWMTEYRQSQTFRPATESSPPGLGRFLGEFALVRGDDCAAAGPADRLALLRGLMTDLAAADDARLSRLLEEFMAGHRAAQLRQIQITMNQAAAAGAPDYWRADAKSWLEHELDQITDRAPPRPRDLPADAELSDCITALRQCLDRQARWLAAWPSLWEYAAENGPALRDL